MPGTARTAARVGASPSANLTSCPGSVLEKRSAMRSTICVRLVWAVPPKFDGRATARSGPPRVPSLALGGTRTRNLLT